MKRVLPIVYIVCSLWITACGNESAAIYPAVQLEFVTLSTDQTEEIRYLKLDKGETLRIHTDHTEQTLSSYTGKQRGVSNFVKLTEKGEKVAEVYSFTPIAALAPVPIQYTNYPENRSGAVSLQSIWLSGDYINLTLGVAPGKENSIRFIQQSMTTEEENTTVSLMLYYDNGDLFNNYSQRTYASIPLEGYKEYPSPIHIQVTILTFREGLKTYQFLYDPI
ncbi:MAG: NigD-like protein [Bacteroides sp.]|nr:NigD-like protein [Bacteroides sp.]